MKKLLLLIITLVLIEIVVAPTIDSTSEWIITKTGAEEYLELDYTMNNTHTEFCIRFNDKNAYIQAISLSAQQINSIPIKQTEGNDLTLPNIVDLTNADISKPECFLVYHPKGINNQSFKIGLNSVQIYGTGIADATALQQQKNLVITSDDILHSVYIDYGGGYGGYDVHYANSSDKGATWTEEEIITGTFDDVGIIVNSTDALIVYYEDGAGHIDQYVSLNNGVTWTGPTTMMDIAMVAFHYPVCVIDVNDIIHCCAIQNTKDELYYVNSSQYNTEVEVNTNNADDSDYCSIAVDSNNVPFIVATGTDHDDVDIWSPALNGWGSSNRVEIDAGTSYTNPDITIDSNDNIFVTWDESIDLWVANSTDGGSTWTPQEIDTSDSDTPTIVHTEQDDLYIIYASVWGNNGYVYMINSTDAGATWGGKRRLESSSGYPSVLGTLNPSFNNIENVLKYVVTDSGNDINFGNINIPYAFPGIVKTCNTDGSGGNTTGDCINRNEDSTDATFDSCTDGSTAGFMYINNIYLNATSAEPEDTILAVCEVCCYSSGTGYGIWYYNSTGWNFIDGGNCIDGSSAASCSHFENKTAVIKLNNTEGEHVIRCWQEWSLCQVPSEEICCDDGSFADNDDVNITVAEPVSNPTFDLNSPDNNSNQYLNEVTINYTIYDDATMNSSLYISNDTTNLYEYLVQKNVSISHNTEIIHNFTEMPTIPKDEYQYLFHFDSETRHGESSSFLKNFGNESNENITDGTFPTENTTHSKFGSSMDFDGSSQYIYLDGGDNANPVFDAAVTHRTIFFWFRARDVTSRQFIHEEGGNLHGINIRIEDGMLHGVATQSNVATEANISISANTSYFAAVIISDTDDTITVYLDGVTNSTSISTGGISARTGDDAIGRIEDNGRIPSGTISASGNYYNGYLDEYGVINEALTTAQLDAIFEVTYDTYYWLINVTDGTNTNQSEMRQFNIISKPIPSVDLDAPADAFSNYTTNENNIDFSWTVTSTIDSSLLCNLTIDGIVNVSNVNSTNGTSTSQNVADFSIGSHSWNVTCINSISQSNTSETRTFSILANPINITLNTPTNNSEYVIDVFNITLNSTLIRHFTDSIDTNIYVRQDSVNNYTNGLVYKDFDLANGTEITYNFTAHPAQPDGNTILLVHLDNLSEYGESDTVINDFSSNNNDGTGSSGTDTENNNYDYFANDAENYNWWSDGRGYPSALEYNDVTYISYLGEDYQPNYISYNQTSGVWSSTTDLTHPGPGVDNHNVPTINYDDNGRLHTIFCGHSSDCQYYISTNPEDISSFTDNTSQLPEIDKGTYPQLNRFSDGGLGLLVRDRSPSHAKGEWWIMNSSNNGANWSTPFKILNVDDVTQDQWFASGFIDTNDRWHIVTTHAPTWGQCVGFYYMYADPPYDSSSWKNYTGDVQVMPIHVDNDTRIKISDLDWTSRMPNIKADSSGNPYIMVYHNISATKYNTLLWLNGSTWEEGNITTASFSQFDIIIHNQNNISVYGYTGGYIYEFYTTNNGSTWTNESIISSGGSVSRVKTIYNANISRDPFLLYRRSVLSSGYPLYMGNYSGYLFNNTYTETTSSVVQSEKGKIAWAGNFESYNAQINFGADSSLDFDITQDYTWGFWIYPEDPPSRNDNDIPDGNIISKTTLEDSGYRIIFEDNKIKFANESNGGVLTNDTIQNETWTHIGITYSNGNIELYINGILNGTGSANFVSDTTSDLIFGKINDSSLSFEGVLDDVVIKDEKLSSTEIKNIFRANAGKYHWKVNGSDSEQSNESNEQIFYINANELIVTLNAPDNATISTSTSHSFNWTVTGLAGVDTDCNLTIDGIVNVSNIISTTYTMINQTVNGFSIGLHNWSVSCNYTSGTDYFGTSETRLFVKTPISINLTLDYPANDSNVTTSSVSFNVTATSEDGTVESISLFVSNVSDLNDTNALVGYTESAISGTQYTFTGIDAIPIKSDDTGLVLLAHMDTRSEHGETTTNVYDFVNNDNGTVSGAAVNYTGGKLGGCYEFNGINNQITFPNTTNTNFINTSNYTWVAWIKRGTVSGFDAVIAKDDAGGGINKNGFQIRLNSTNYLQFVSNVGSGTIYGVSNVSIDTNWTHIATTYNNATVELYVNGSLVNTSTGWYLSETQSPLRIGSNELFPNYFNGSIDEVGMWNRILSATEILDLSRMKDQTYYWEANASTVLSSNSTWNGTYQFLLNTTAVVSDSCTYSGSGDFIVDCGDHCIISTETSVIPYNVYLENTGNFTVEADIHFRNITGNYNCELIIGAGALYPSIGS